MKKKQLAKLGVTLGLVAAVGVGGTLAVLSQTSGPVTNTFAVGKNINENDFFLQEHEVELKNGNYEEKEDAQWTYANSYDNLLPKATLDKDPTVRFAEDLEEGKTPDVYMFVKVEGLDELKNNKITLNDWGNEWELVKIQDETATSVPVNKDTAVDGIYVYKTTNQNEYKITPTAGLTLGSLFTELSVASNFAADSFTQKTIRAWACAVQYDNVDLTEAYNTAKAQFDTITDQP